jgi:uncharacterized protein (DUF1800 family)
MPSSRPTATRRVAPLVVLAAALAGAAVAQPPAPSTARVARAEVTRLRAAPREMTADQQRWHALTRLAFGPRPGDIERLRRIGVDRWIDEQLAAERLADPAMDRFVARFPTLGQSMGTLLADYPPPGAQLARLARSQRPTATGDAMAPGMATAGDLAGALPPAERAALARTARESYRFVGELQAARVGRAVASERQLQEVLVDFWLNHFSVFAGKDRVRYALPEYEATIRTHTLGRFRDLLGAVATSPAMLLYLDQAQSVADSTRPTLGRRPTDRQLRRLAGRAPALRELPDSQRSAAMEAVLARRPRGLNENYARELLELHTLGVDGGYTQQDVIEVARALTGWTLARGALGGGGFTFRPPVHDAGPKVILGQRFPAGGGREEGERVLDLLARHPSTARFIATKLARRLVADTPPPALVERAAQAYLATDGEIREVVRVITASPEFWAATAWRAKVKSPFELVVSAMRALGAAPDTTPFTAQVIGRLGQPLFGHQAPNGWPETGDAWINTGAILNRINFGLAVAGDRRPAAPLTQWPEGAALAAASREAQVEGVVRSFFAGQVSPETRAVLLSGAHPLLAAGAPADDMAAAADAATAAPPTDGRPSRGMAGGGRMRGGAGAGAARQAAREAVRPGRGGTIAQLYGASRPLDGLPQVVGLALGAPEFQRR